MTEQKLANHAIIIGGSIAGLLAARVLSEYVSQVTVIEKDALTAEPARRKGTPQATQFHSLHQAGADIISQLLPDMMLDLPSSGLLPADIGADVQAFFYGGWLPQLHVGSNIYWCDRPRFEWTMRQHVTALANVELISGAKVAALRHDKDQRRITGVTLRTAEEEQTISADIVIDAGGRGSRMPQWLRAIGCGSPPESNLRINMGDVTGIFQLPVDETPEWKAMVIGTQPGVNNKMGGAHRLPNNQIKVLLAGWFGDHPPTDEAGFVAFSRKLSQPDLYNVLRQAKLVSPVSGHKLPSNQWRHYEKMADMPDGLFVLGDAICSFNPGYGQGMTVTAMHVMALQAVLNNLRKRGQTLAQRGVNRRFQKAAASVSQKAWMSATSEDLRYPQAEGARPLPLRLMQRHLDKVMAIAHHNPDVTRRFYEVMTFRRSPASIFYPDVLWAIVKHEVGQLFGQKVSLRNDTAMQPH